MSLLTEQEILTLFDEAYATVGKTAIDFAHSIESAVIEKPSPR